MPRRHKPHAEIIQYKQLKTAAGGSGSFGGGGGGFAPGQNLICKVSHAEPSGYAVIIVKDNLPGFLPTEVRLRPGEEILAQFVCVSNRRILLSSRFGDTKGHTDKPKPA